MTSPLKLIEKILSNRPNRSKEEWLKEVEDTRPANEAGGQNTTSASRTNCWRRDAVPKLLQRESSTDVDVDDV